VSRWHTIDRDLLLKLRNAKSAEFRALINVDTGDVKSGNINDALQAAALQGCISALDAVLEASKTNGIVP
jgi:hypothetical protein